MSNTKYDSALRDKVIRLHLEEGRSLRSLKQSLTLVVVQQNIGLINIAKSALAAKKAYNN